MVLLTIYGIRQSGQDAVKQRRLAGWWDVCSLADMRSCTHVSKAVHRAWLNPEKLSMIYALNSSPRSVKVFPGNMVSKVHFSTPAFLLLSRQQSRNSSDTIGAAAGRTLVLGLLLALVSISDFRMLLCQHLPQSFGETFPCVGAHPCLFSAKPFCDQTDYLRVLRYLFLVPSTITWKRLLLCMQAR